MFYFLTKNVDICYNCLVSPQAAIASIGFKVRKKERRLKESHLICVSCTGSSPSDDILCESLDCPWFYARRKAEAGMELIPLYDELTMQLEQEIEGDYDEEREEWQYSDSEDALKYDSDLCFEYEIDD